MNARFKKCLLIVMLAAFYLALFGVPIVAQEKKIVRGSKVVVRNDYGSITITGWEGETIEAFATDVSRAQSVPVSISDNLPVSNTILVITKPDKSDSPGKIRLEVKLPRYVELEAISTVGHDLAVSDVEGVVNMKTDRGEILIRHAGAVNAQTGSGEISAENVTGDLAAKSESGNIKLADVKGFVDVTTTNGNIEVRRVEGSVRIAAINGKVLVQCVDGGVEIRDTSSQIRLLGVTGDIDVSTSNGKADSIGMLNRASHYRLKTLSGAVSMLVTGDVGFTATLSSYGGQVETDFKLQPDSQMSGKTNRRGIVRLGDGGARIEMDSFDGRVRLGRIVTSAMEKCER